MRDIGQRLLIRSVAFYPKAPKGHPVYLSWTRRNASSRQKGARGNNRKHHQRHRPACCNLRL